MIPWFVQAVHSQKNLHPFSSYFFGGYFGWNFESSPNVGKPGGGGLGKQVGNSSGDKFLVDRLSWNLWCLECFKLCWTSCPDNAVWRLGWRVRSIIPKDLTIQVYDIFKHTHIYIYKAYLRYLLHTVNVLYAVCRSSQLWYWYVYIYIHMILCICFSALNDCLYYVGVANCRHSLEKVTPSLGCCVGVSFVSWFPHLVCLWLVMTSYSKQPIWVVEIQKRNL